ncbi:MAG: recombination-associated protein RdgC [Gammaproteobacteria bacterium]|mgnify:CR=1 FL=1|nr:recombination-associated protein RdgC [Gammaproteobacteria bacterium]MBC55209.1 recombination-associated protein RdgC [Gammaproteobacteria bacterium]
MWFKNIRLYQFTRPFALSADELEQKLSECPFQPCSSFERSRFGWVSPLGKDAEALTHSLGQCIMVCARKDEKLLPASVVNDAVNEKVEELEAEQSRKVYRKEKLQIKDDVTAALLPRAFSRTRKVFAYIDAQAGLLVINTSSASAAEELISGLRECLGSMPVVPADVQQAPAAVMTGWLQAQVADGQFEISENCELINPAEDGNSIRCSGQDLTAEEISVHLAAGKQVRKLGVVWNQSLSCVLADDLTISRLRFEDMILEKAQEADAETAAQQFDQDFAVMNLTLSGLFNALFAVFGGARAPDTQG